MLDPFVGSNTADDAAESLGRRWLAFERNSDCLNGLAFHLMADWPDEEADAFVAAA